MARRAPERPLTLYAIVDARCPTPRVRGLSGGLLGSLVVGRARFVFERAAPPEPTAPSLRAFDAVIRRLARECRAVLPFRFGSKARNAEAVSELFAESDRAIVAALARVRDHVQFTHRVYGDVARTKAPRRAGGPGTQWLDARAASQRMPEILPLRKAVASIVRELRVERADRPPLVGSLYALVPAAKVTRYQQVVAEAVERLEAIRVETTGPWPAYAFADLW